MLRLLLSITLVLPLMLSEPAQAECYSPDALREFEREYNEWLEHRIERKKHRRKHRGGCRGGHRKPPHRFPPPHFPHPLPCNPCVVIPPSLPKPVPPLVDRGFCLFSNSEYRSEVFEFGGQQHLLSMVVLDNEVVIELVKFNGANNISDDDKYFASPEGFAHPAEPSNTPLAFFPEAVQTESNMHVCDNSRSLAWGNNQGKVVPNFFAGRIDLYSIKDAIYTKTLLSTDLSSSAYMDIKLKKVPDKPGNQK